MTSFTSLGLGLVFASAIGFTNWQPVAPALDDTAPAAPDAIAREVAVETERMAFMVGDWRVEARIKAPNGYLRGSGTMKVHFEDDELTLLADMNVSFPTFAVVGTTRRSYNHARELWDVAWIVDGPGSVPDIEGRFQNGRFIELDFGSDARGAYIGRLVISEMTADRFVVRKDQLYDDGTLAPEIWAYEAVRRADPDARSK